MYNLSINLLILVYYKKKVGKLGLWKKFYKLFNMQSELIIIEIPYGSTKFRSILIKPYFNNNIFIDKY